MPEHRINNRIINSNSNLNNPVTYFHWKILALAGIWTRDLPGTKPICYQLSYPGLDRFSSNQSIPISCVKRKVVIKVNQKFCDVTFCAGIFVNNIQQSSDTIKKEDEKKWGWGWEEVITIFVSL